MNDSFVDLLAEASFFINVKLKNPAFSEIAAKTHSPFGPYLAGQFAYIPPALEKGWIFYLPRGKIEPPVGTQQPQIGGIKSSFSKFYGKVCVIS